MKFCFSALYLGEKGGGWDYFHFNSNRVKQSLKTWAKISQSTIFPP